MNRWLRHALLFLCTVAFWPGGARCQYVRLPSCHPGTPFYCVDAACFREARTSVLEIYLELCNESLQFLKTPDGYRASADVTAVLYDRSGKQLAGDTYRVRLSASRYEETTSVDSCKTLTMSFKAPPGEYRLAVTLADRDSRRKSVIEALTEVMDFGESPVLSDIGFIVPREGPGKSRWPGYQANVRRNYGKTDEGILFYYEIYNVDDDDSLGVIYSVKDSEGGVIQSDTALVVPLSSEGRVARVPLDTLSNGQYLLELALLDDSGGQVVSRSRGFEINREEFYLGRDVGDAVALLTYIASAGFIDSFADADAEERKRMWEQFWREKDPTPATPRNEYYDEHVKRFRYANMNFAAGMAEGWRTDRGRIYILEGPPDEIESYSMEIDRNPTEVWFYFDNGRRYVFVDETGFGDYILVDIR
jgi:GWxTD domain-containing protein